MYRCHYKTEGKSESKTVDRPSIYRQMRGLIAKQQAILISEIKERQMIGRQGSFDRKTVERYGVKSDGRICHQDKRKIWQQGKRKVWQQD